MSDAYETVYEILERKGMTRAARTDAILEALSVYDDVYVVEPNKAHAPIQQVEIYGLIIDVDANDYAARVGFPYGARIVVDDE